MNFVKFYKILKYNLIYQKKARNVFIMFITVKYVISI